MRLAVVSAADPVERGSGRLVHLSDSPFLLGELNPAEVLAPQVAGPVIVDNDVNWAARAEREHGSPGSLDDFAYVFLGEGLGCAIVSDGEVSRGYAGLAGEIAHLITVGPHGQATRLIEVFGELGLRRAGSTAIDAGRLAQRWSPARTLRRRARGMPWAGPSAESSPPSSRWPTPGWSSSAAPGAATLSSWRPSRRPSPSSPGMCPSGPPSSRTSHPSLAGARSDAVRRLRSAIVAAAHPPARA